MANLTMLIIVVFLSAMLFVWAISSFGVYQGGAGYWFSSKSLANQERISIENVNFVTSTCGSSTCHFLKIYVRNVGAVPFTVGGVYLNGSLLPRFPQDLSINVTQVCLLSAGCNSAALGYTLSSPNLPTHGDIQTIKVATIRGTIQTSQWIA